jgi:hypothetical protein
MPFSPLLIYLQQPVDGGMRAWRPTGVPWSEPIRFQVYSVWAARAGSDNFSAYSGEHDRPPAL